MGKKLWEKTPMSKIHKSVCYSKSTESVNQQNSCVWSKISYRIFYQTPTKYIYLESAHRDLQNGVKIWVKLFLSILIRIDKNNL